MLSPEGSELSLAFLDLTEIPIEVVEKYGKKIEKLDLTGNSLRFVNN